MKRYYEKIFLTIITSFFLFYGSNGQSFSTISGKVSDVKGNPIENVSVYLSNSPYGTYSNEEGIFKLTIPRNDGYDSLTFSRMGFKQNSLKFTSLSVDYNAILIEQVYQIVPVDVYHKDFALKLVKKALQKKLLNIKTEPYEQQAYSYYFIKSNNKISGIYESTFDVLHLGYNVEFTKSYYRYLPTSMIHVNQDRGSKFTIKHDKRGFPISNWNNLQLYKIIKDLNFDGIFSIEKTGRWSFSIEEVQREQNRELYKVKFLLNDALLKKINGKFQNYKPIQESFYDGYIYIDKNNLEIYRVQLTTNRFSKYYEKYQDNATNHLFKPISINLDIQYRYYDDYSYISQFKLIDHYIDYGWGDTEIDVTEFSEVVVNNLLSKDKIDFSFIESKYGPLMKERRLYFQAPVLRMGKYDESFWKSYDASLLNLERKSLNVDDKIRLNEEFIEKSNKALISQYEITELRLKYR